MPYWTAGRVRLLRRTLGETQVIFAARLGVMRRHLARIEAGHRGVTGPVRLLLDRIVEDNHIDLP